MTIPVKEKIIKIILIYAITLIFLIPLYWLIISSLKTDSEITRFPPTFFPKVFSFKNFPNVWRYLHFTRTFFNSLIVSVPTTMLIALFSSMAGYAFSKLRFLGKNIILLLLVGSLTIPPAALLLPLFFIITKMGMYDNLIGLVLPFGVTVFGIFFMKQSIDHVPDSVLHSARIDGCGEFVVFFRIILPILKPSLTSLIIIEFVNNWNSFTMPLVLLKTNDKFTIPLRLGMLSQETVSIPWSQIMAANVLVVIPVVIIFLILQKFFVSGIMRGALKE